MCFIPPSSQPHWSSRQFLDLAGLCKGLATPPSERASPERFETRTRGALSRRDRQRLSGHRRREANNVQQLLRWVLGESTRGKGLRCSTPLLLNYLSEFRSGCKVGHKAHLFGQLKEGCQTRCNALRCRVQKRLS
jgi:hypothetical protein